MKKLIPLLLAILALCGYAQAEELVSEEIIITEPRLMQQSVGIMPLSDEPSVEEQLYAVLEEGLCAHAASIDVSKFEIPYNGHETDDTPVTFSEMANIFCTAVYNHPEYGDLRTALQCSYDKVTNLISGVIPIYLDNYYQAEYDRVVDYTVSRVIAPGMTDMDKLLAIHDFLAEKITYSTKMYMQLDVNGNPIRDDNENIIYEYDSSVFTPYGALVNYDAVCQGYALAFKLLCDRAGINCGYATAGKHMWNIVELDGNYYHVDVTWDDSPPTRVAIDNEGNYVIAQYPLYHKYFLISDEENRNNRSTYGNYSLTGNVESCDDSTLHSTLFVADKNFPFYWRGNRFWYRPMRFERRNGIIVYVTYGEQFYLKNNSAVNISADEYLPDHRLDAELFPAFDGKTAIDGLPRQKADFYAAVYDADGTLTGVEKADVTFDSRGRAVIETGDYSKLMLLSDNGLDPLAYPFYN